MDAQLEVMSELEALARLRRHEWPRRSFQAILRGLAAPREDVRRLAVRLARRSVHAEVVSTLLRLAGEEPDAQLRLEVVDTLGQLLARGAAFGFDIPCNPVATTEARWGEVKRTLRAIYHSASTDQRLRLAALVAAARGGESWAAGATRSAWRLPDPAWQLAALRAMRWLPGFDAAIEQALESKDLEHRLAAMRAAGKHRVLAAGPLALEVAADERAPESLRVAAVDALGRIAPPGAEALLRRLCQGDSGALRAHADAALGDIELGAL